YPVPGAHVAAPQTQITFRGLPARRLGQVIIIGARTGWHTGLIEADSDGRGGSFLPSKPFAPGEVVTVRTRQHIRGARSGTFRFTVATPSGSVPSMPLAPAPRVPGDQLTFYSRPDLTPASVELTVQSPYAAAGDVFITPQQGPTQNGPMILGPDGQLVWFQPVPPGDIAADLRVQRYLGRPVLTWWQGYSGAGVGAGQDMVYDSSYRQVAVVRAGNGLSADLHEFRLTPQGTALVTAYYPVYWNASALHGPEQQVVLDSVVQEIDVRTGLVLYQWDSLDHVPLADSYQALPPSAGAPFDYFHINSVEQQGDGDLLISARNTWAAYDVDHQRGATVWTLGGKRSSFRFGSGAVFAFQHDVRLHSEADPTVTLFDDGAGLPRVHSQSRGMTVRLDDKTKTATLVIEDLHSPAVAASFEGNLQPLPGGDEFVGWGQQPYFTEFNSQGRMVFDGRFVDANSSYRAYRFVWTGTPRTPPALAAASSGSTTNVFVSWNGATQVASWRVLAGPSPDALQAVLTGPKQGFESQLVISTQPYVAVQALDRAGRVLAASSTLHAS
ncbi:MAG: arylsulfotransferase family protein, partial [Solirubrobacterales bacterium]|nr:arylsulfotransferase family protein [Solirubrobacterales bacterium]